MANSIRQYSPKLAQYPAGTPVTDNVPLLGWNYRVSSGGANIPTIDHDATIGSCIQSSPATGTSVDFDYPGMGRWADSIIKCRVSTLNSYVRVAIRVNAWNNSSAYNGHPKDGVGALISAGGGTSYIWRGEFENITQLAVNSDTPAHDRSDFTFEYRAIGDTYQVFIDGRDVFGIVTDTRDKIGRPGFYPTGAGLTKFSEIEIYVPNAPHKGL